jgi:uncharacterized lipoprotein YddW (UPF0748 family)
MKPQIDTDKNRFYFDFTRWLFLHILCVLCVLCGSFFVAEAQVKGVWVRPFIGATEDVRKDALKGREFVRAELQKIKRANLNTVYLEVFWDGYTIYPSRISPQRPLSINYGVADERGKVGTFCAYTSRKAKNSDLRFTAGFTFFTSGIQT